METLLAAPAAAPQCLRARLPLLTPGTHTPSRGHPSSAFLRRKSLWALNLELARLGPTGRAAAARKGSRVAAEQTVQPLAAAGAVLTSVAEFWRRLMPFRGRPSESEPEPAAGAMEPRRCVAVLGATGRMGRHIVKGLLAEGHSVVACASSRDRALQVLVKEEGLQAARASPPEPGYVAVAEVDVQDTVALRAALAGCDSVVCAVGARFGGPAAGYAPASSPEEVYGSIPAAVRVCAEVFAERRRLGGEEGELPLFEFGAGGAAAAAAAAGAEKAVANGGVAGRSTGGEGQSSSPTTPPEWRRLDDVIMGGKSQSTFEQTPEGAKFSGEVNVDGGGFCGARADVPGGPADLARFDGIALRVKGDGQRYKMNLRSTPEWTEFQYQASFDTVRGEWVTLFIPFDCFQPVMRARIQRDATPLPRNQIFSVGLVLSRFQYEGDANPLFQPGAFQLLVEKIYAYRRPRPQFVLVSSAAVERNARAVTPEQRERSIPIVKLNPGGILTYKLAGEDALRASGLGYAVVRPCGLTDKDADIPFTLEVAQGDAITGALSRQEAAAVCVAALQSPDALNTTFEVRRDELTRGQGTEDWRGLFRRLRPDRRPGFVCIPSPLDNHKQEGASKGKD